MCLELLGSRGRKPWVTVFANSHNGNIPTAWFSQCEWEEVTGLALQCPTLHYHYHHLTVNWHRLVIGKATDLWTARKVDYSMQSHRLERWLSG